MNEWRWAKDDTATPRPHPGVYPAVIACPTCSNFTGDQSEFHPVASHCMTERRCSWYQCPDCELTYTLRWKHYTWVTQAPGTPTPR